MAGPRGSITVDPATSGPGLAGPRTWAITALLVAGAAIHWAFFAVVWLSIAGAVVVAPPGGSASTPAAEGVRWWWSCSALAGAAPIYLALGAWPNPPVVDEGEFTSKTDTFERIGVLLPWPSRG